jgi:mannose-6-phosphate isomerase-like protein (cupin superfamily)
MHLPLPQNVSISVGPDDGETITDRPERAVRILVAGDEHGTITWSRYGRGERGPDLHVHHEHTDAFYVLAGALTFALGPEGERTVHAPAGTVVVVPPDVAHAFRNDDVPDAVFLNVHTPDKGFAEYMRALRDGEPAAFDSYDMPVDGTLPAGAAIVVEAGEGEPGPGTGTVVRYVGEDLVLTEEPDRITVAIPASPGPDVVFVTG